MQTDLDNCSVFRGTLK